MLPKPHEWNSGAGTTIVSPSRYGIRSSIAIDRPHGLIWSRGRALGRPRRARREDDGAPGPAGRRRPASVPAGVGPTDQVVEGPAPRWHPRARPPAAAARRRRRPRRRRTPRRRGGRPGGPGQHLAQLRAGEAGVEVEDRRAELAARPRSPRRTRDGCGTASRPRRPPAPLGRRAPGPARSSGDRPRPTSASPGRRRRRADRGAGPLPRRNRPRS